MTTRDIPASHDPALCPVCLERYIIRCKCLRGDRSCKNGHHWHCCTVHDKLVTGESDHGKPGCSCDTEANQ